MNFWNDMTTERGNVYPKRKCELINLYFTSLLCDTTLRAVTVVFYKVSLVPVKKQKWWNGER